MDVLEQFKFLILAIVLVALFGLLVIFGLLIIWRRANQRSRKQADRSPTTYSDAWSEAGQRLSAAKARDTETPHEDEDDFSPGQP